ncbi:MAG: caspase family protein [Prevotella sp.]|nr:caspase family protein [Prevotella sp.]
MRLRKLLALLMLCAVSHTAQSRVFLVAVGLSDYPGTVNDLNLCDNDARTINWVYKKNQDAITRVITNSNATVGAVTRLMDELYTQAQEDDILVFFFSGHGIPGAFMCYDGKLDYDIVRNSMAKSKSRHKMIFADACFSGKMRQENSYSNNQNQNNYASFDVMLFLSSRNDEVSRERRDMKNGLFTAYLQRGLRGGADYNKDRRITAKELFQFVSNGVRKMTRDQQHPVMWGKFSDDMTVLNWQK